MSSRFPSQGDAAAEPGIGLGAAGRLPQLRRDGKEPNASTLFRWTTRGVRRPGGGRVVLETWLVGGRRLTSAAAVDRFIAALNQPTGDRATALPANMISEHRRAELELHAVGI